MIDTSTALQFTIDKDFNFPEGWDYDSTLALCQTRLSETRDITETKRQKKREQLKLYVNQYKAPERISDNTLYATVQSWMATNLSDQKSTTWLGRQWSDEDIAENLNNTAKFDWEEMNMPEHDIKRRWQEAIFGVSILVKDKWMKNNCPTWKVIDPLAWFPDKKGWLCSRNFRYMFFETSSTVNALKKNKYKNTGIIDALSRSSDTVIQNDIAYSTPRLLVGDQKPFEGDTQLIEGYIRIDGLAYAVSFDTACSVLTRFEKIQPVTKAEREDETLIDFPVILRYVSPIPNDPWGVSIADLVEDEQMAMTILKNLKMIREKDLALGDTVLVSELVKNRTDLLKAPSLSSRRFVSVDSDNVQNLTAPIPKGQGSSDYYNFQQQLRSDSQLYTGIGATQSGVTESTTKTLGEIQAAQRGASARFLLGFQIALVADKQFWKLWYRCYQEFMPEKSEKLIRINSGLSPKVSVLSRKDITAIEDPDVVLDSEDNIKRIQNEIRDSWIATYNFYIQDPDIPNIAKALFKRKFYQIVHKTNKEEAYQKVPPSAHELFAWEDVKALNRGDMVYPDQSVDPYTMLFIAQSAEDSKEKFAYIEMCKLMIIMSGVQQGTAQGNSTASQTQAQVTNNMIQQSNKPQEQPLSLTM